MTLELFVRNTARETIGQITTWQKLTMVERRNDPGRWTLTLHSEADADLLTPGTGIIIRRDGATLMSGWLESRQFTRSGAEVEWVLSGWDDMIHMATTECWPKPASAIGSQTDIDDRRTGTISARIIGYWNANVVTRLAIPGAVAPTDPGLGASGTSRARFHKLLEKAQEAAGKAVNFRVVQHDTALTLAPSFRLPTDLRLAVQFSPEVGTVTGYTWSDTAPTATRIYVGAGGEGTARAFTQYLDTAAEAVWGSVRKTEQFVDRRDLDPGDGTYVTEVAQAGAEALLENRRRVSFQMQATDTEGLRYGIDYRVGDLVRAYPEPGEPLDDLVEEVEVTFDADGGEQTQVWVGPRQEPDEANALRERNLTRRIGRLEAAQ